MTMTRRGSESQLSAMLRVQVNGGYVKEVQGMAYRVWEEGEGKEREGTRGQGNCGKAGERVRTGCGTLVNWAGRHLKTL